MAYTKTEWSCGDKITVGKLNNIEDGIEEALDKGYECTETRTVLADESITTTVASSTAIGDFITNFTFPKGAIVTIDGVAYEFKEGEPLGDPYLVTYPFYIQPGLEGSVPVLETKTAGTYSVKVESIERTADVDPCFCKAVTQCVSPGYKCTTSDRTVFSTSITTTDTSDGFSTGKTSDVWHTNQYPDEITVMLDGTSYICKRTNKSTYIESTQGSIEIIFESNATLLVTEKAGTHSIDILVEQASVIISSCFKAAVKNCDSSIEKAFTDTVDGVKRIYYNITFEELYTMINVRNNEVHLVVLNSSVYQIYRLCTLNDNDATATFYTIDSTGAINTLLLHSDGVGFMYATE